MKHLRDDRSTCPARHDDRPLGPEGPAGADGDRRRERFEHRNFRLYLAAADQDRLQRLRDTVAPDPVRAIPRHQSDNQTADHRDEDHARSQVVLRRADEGKRKMLIEEEIGKEADELQEDNCHHGADGPDDQRNG